MRYNVVGFAAEKMSEFLESPFIKYAHIVIWDMQH